MASGHGTFSDADMYSYQLDVWSRPDVAGYNELMDMTDVKHIALPSVGRMRQIAELAAKMDVLTTKSKFAIVAPDDLAFGLARMFASFRGSDERSTKEVGVFRSQAEAFEFLGISAG